MQFFADENVAAQIVRQLRDLGHDVLYPPDQVMGFGTLPSTSTGTRFYGN